VPRVQRIGLHRALDGGCDSIDTALPGHAAIAQMLKHGHMVRAHAGRYYTDWSRKIHNGKRDRRAPTNMKIVQKALKAGVKIRFGTEWAHPMERADRGGVDSM